MHTRLSPPTELLKAAHEFLHYRGEETAAGKVKNSARDILKGYLTATGPDGEFVNGREDGEGHRYWDFEEPLVIGGTAYTGIQAQRRASSGIDLDAAEKLAKDKGIYDQVFPEVVIREFDEDALFAANQEGKVSDDELDELEVLNETYAILPVKA